MKLLMHICCAPCANMPIDALRADGIDLTGYWYNPNIHPFTEYRARRNCLQEYAKTIGLPLLVRDDYGLRPFVRAVADDIAGRCVKCYEMRLFEAARPVLPFHMILAVAVTYVFPVKRFDTAPFSPLANGAVTNSLGSEANSCICSCSTG